MRCNGLAGIVVRDGSSCGREPLIAGVGAKSMTTSFKQIAIAVALICCTTAGHGDETPLLNATSARAFEIEKEADYVVDYTTDEQYDIGIGHVEDNVRHSHLFTQNELEYYFGQLKHKDLIVVVIRKNKWDKDTASKRVEQINSFLFKCGFSRVVIQQGYGFARGIWSDKTKPQQAH